MTRDLETVLFLSGDVFFNTVNSTIVDVLPPPSHICLAGRVVKDVLVRSLGFPLECAGEVGIYG